MVSLLFGNFGFFFRGLGYYENWRLRQTSAMADGITHDAELIRIDSVVACSCGSPGSIAVHVHLFYSDLIPEFAGYLQNIPFPFSLFVSVPDKTIAAACEASFTTLAAVRQLTVRVVENRGRDLAPFVCEFGQDLAKYDFVAHFHGKKSLYTKGTMDGWRSYLLKQLLGSPSTVRRIFSLLNGKEQVLGIVYPQVYEFMPYWGNTWLSSRHLARGWASRLGVKAIPEGYFDYSSGSMFWARKEAICKLWQAGIVLDDFEIEAGQTDGTLAHCLERFPVLLANQAGFGHGILRDEETPSWSKWRLDQYFSRGRDGCRVAVEDSQVRIVIFDIFDTLLSRPLIDPEHVKHIVASRISDNFLREQFIALRYEAEGFARNKKGQDVGLPEIYEQMAVLVGAPVESLSAVMELEVAVELASVRPRPEVLTLLEHARSAGKRIILASDMFLPRIVVEEMLAAQGVAGYDHLYLSSEIGLRKDTGAMYRLILQDEMVAAHETLMVGDNEHSDVQIAADLGMRICHVMRPVEMAKVSPRLGKLFSQVAARKGIDDSIALGLVVRRLFQPLSLSQEDFFSMGQGPEEIGYSVAGPIIVSYIQWLVDAARRDGISCLYFLAREGQILKAVYDKVAATVLDAVPSQYLVVSRRAVSVPLIEGFEDIVRIAGGAYWPTSLATFLSERYGYTLTDEEKNILICKGLWQEDRLVEVCGNAKHLYPVLKELAPGILRQASDERHLFAGYCRAANLWGEKHPAVVDIGYSATIQGYLNRLTGEKIDGYYMMTEKKAAEVGRRYGVMTQGFFHQGIDRDFETPVMLARCFDLEMLLSSDDAQVVRYEKTESGSIAPVFRKLSEKERASSAVRQRMRNGIFEYLEDVLVAEKTLKPGLVVAADVAVGLFEGFVLHLTERDRNALASFALDDYYCGRGVIEGGFA
ncbi:MAG: HAD-IA family hydrolase [Desulfurivibrionaceae bacterium]